MCHSSLHRYPWVLRKACRSTFFLLGVTEEKGGDGLLTFRQSWERCKSIENDNISLSVSAMCHSSLHRYSWLLRATVLKTFSLFGWGKRGRRGEKACSTSGSHESGVRVWYLTLSHLVLVNSVIHLCIVIHDWWKRRTSTLWGFGVKRGRRGEMADSLGGSHESGVKKYVKWHYLT